MTSPEDGATPIKPAPSFAGTPIVLPRSQSNDNTTTVTSPGRNTPTRLTSPTPTPFSPPRSIPSSSRNSSPAPSARLSQSTLVRSPSVATSIGGGRGIAEFSDVDDIRSIIIRAFSPAVAVYASPDTEDLCRRKGFKGGLLQLLRPFGERVPGKVVVRDGVGSSRTWDDFGVRFVDMNGSGAGKIKSPNPGAKSVDLRMGSGLAQLEDVVAKHMEGVGEKTEDDWDGMKRTGNSFLPPASPNYRLYLRRLLSAFPQAPHETFLHPVACVVAISSSNPSPIESLRQLYADTSQGDKRSPLWVNPEYLRYYVLVHDEDNDDITRSTSFFDQMKRHFGLHCHFLRIRSAQCLPDDDLAVPLPVPEWTSPAEALARIDESSEVDVDQPCLFESDITAIGTFIREMVAQSIVPHMEHKVSLWNDQIASKRRGFSGRFMSISKRWTGFGGGRNTAAPNTSGNYDSLQGFYRPDTPEALLRKMADFAFMLRDWKLATSTYDLLRTDFGNDKAWKFHAGVNEMCAISTLLNPLASTTKTRIETTDQMLESAYYSYQTRCSDPLSALRCLALSVELLKTRGGTAAEDAARWGTRILDLGLVGPIGRVLVSERIAASFASKLGAGGNGFGSRKRKAAFWYVTAVDAWLQLGYPGFAKRCLEYAEDLYRAVQSSNAAPASSAPDLPFPEMQDFVDELRRALKLALSQETASTTGDGEALRYGDDDDTSTLVPEPEETSAETFETRRNRRSIIGIPGTAPILGAGVVKNDSFAGEGEKGDDDFE